MVNCSRNMSFSVVLFRWTRAALLILTLSLAPAGCQPPKVFAVSAPGNVIPREEAPAADAVVIDTRKAKKSSRADIVLIYAVAFLILAVLYFKISNTDAH